MDCLLALDQGSSSSRALSIDTKGRVVFSLSSPLNTYQPKMGWMEHHGREILSGSKRVLERALAHLSPRDEVLGLGLATQRSTVVFWDAVTGEVVCPVISWQDGRAAELLEHFPLSQEEVHQKTGLYLTPYYSAPKIQWALQHSAPVKKLLDHGRLRIGPISTYLIWHLTQGDIFGVEPTLAQRMLLFNLESATWDDQLLKAFGVPKECLPEIRCSLGFWGTFRQGKRKIPILLTLGDQQAAAAGSGLSMGSSLINYGTGAFLLLDTGNQRRHIPGLLTSVSIQRSRTETHYFLEGTVNSAASCFDWLSHLGILPSAKDIHAYCVKSKKLSFASPLWALPALGGLGAPRWDYRTRTTLSGLSSQSSREDIVRSFTEGIAFLISDIADHLRRHDVSLGPIRASGGLSRVDYLLQFQADLLQANMARNREKEATALGIFHLVLEQLGMAKKSFTSVDKVFKPGISPKEAEGLKNGWRKFVEMAQKN
ncbi:MAG: hypothetical protein HY399_00055 [Elusimicrobia bacterium]|nr:hypothetical protein [Elusimicrobiota bacterium]